ncbi:MAG: FHA domain-containing protein [Betaproteobacteria bacterium]
MAKLVVNPTSPNRREIPLSRTMIVTIGRDPSNDLVLPDAMVSRRHAVVEHRGAQFFLRDCHSANGSVVNGDRVSECALRDGDLVAIGSMRLLFREEVPSGSGKVVPHPSALPLRCPSCQAEYRRGDLFCRECGAQVAQPSGPPKAVCSSCGAAVPLPARFCSGCGATLSPDGERVDGPPEAARRDTRPVPVSPPAEAAPVASGSMAMAPEPRAGRRPSSDPLHEPSGRPAGERRPEAPSRAARAAQPATPGSRLAAALVDAVFVLSGQVVMLAPVAWYWWARDVPRAPADLSYLPLLASFTLPPLALLLGALYHVYFWSVKGATPGQELLDLRVEAEDGRSPIGIGCASLRALGYLLGLASLGVGFAPIAFGGGGLHDRIAGTRVVRGSGR